EAGVLGQVVGEVRPVRPVIAPGLLPEIDAGVAGRAVDIAQRSDGQVIAQHLYFGRRPQGLAQLAGGQITADQMLHGFAPRYCRMDLNEPGDGRPNTLLTASSSVAPVLARAGAGEQDVGRGLSRGGLSVW